MSNTMLRFVALVLSAALIAGAPRAAAQSDGQAELLLREAMHAELSDGDLQRAIELYRTIAERYGDVRPVAAQALLRMGMSYEKLGMREAHAAYQELLSDYADQTEPAGEARARLAALPAIGTTAASEGNGSVARLVWRATPGDGHLNDFFVLDMSQDGKRVAYARIGSRGNLEVRDLATGETTTMFANDPEDPASMHGFVYTLAWSPDGDEIAFSSADLDVSGVATLKIVDTATRAVTVPPATAALNLHVLDWSKDGRFLLGRMIRPDNTVSLVRIDAGTWELVPLLSQGWNADSAAVFSPDGRHVVFSIIEDGTRYIDVLAVDGGSRYRISTDGANASNPLWSPDGSTIIYRSERSTWAASVVDGAPQGPPRLVGSALGLNAFRWTEQGGLSYVAMDPASAAYRVGIDPDTVTATGDVEALPGISREVNWLAWSPDMARLAFTERTRQAIHVYSISDGTEKSIPLGPGQGPSRIWWDASGERVFTVPYDAANRTILEVDVDSGAVRPLFAPLSPAERFHLNADGTMMISYLGSRTPRARRLVISDTGDPEGRVLASEPDPDGGFSNYVRPTFSPDGTRVLFGRHHADDEGFTTALWVVSTDGSGLRNLAEITSRRGGEGERNGSIQYASWSPDSRYVAYTNGRSDLFVVDVDSGQQRVIPVPEEWESTTVRDWSPDGRWLGVVVWMGSQPELWTIHGFLAEEASPASRR